MFALKEQVLPDGITRLSALLSSNAVSPDEFVHTDGMSKGAFTFIAFAAASL
jgi:hypothetical protein